jgi:hypothetical protein
MTMFCVCEDGDMEAKSQRRWPFVVAGRIRRRESGGAREEFYLLSTLDKQQLNACGAFFWVIQCS